MTRRHICGRSIDHKGPVENVELLTTTSDGRIEVEVELLHCPASEDVQVRQPMGWWLRVSLLPEFESVRWKYSRDCNWCQRRKF